MLKILVIRNDKLGDFMLAWPALALLKKQYPESSITVLLPSYTKPVAEICPWIDNVIVDDQHKDTFSDALHLSKKLKKCHFNASISLYSEMRTSLALWLARIPERYGPATKLAQAFLNETLKQKRSSSSKPEHEYNTDLIRHFISCRKQTMVKLPTPPYLAFDTNLTASLAKTYRDKHKIQSEKILIFIHAGSGGSAINLSIQQFAELILLINKKNNSYFVLTAGPGELQAANKLSSLLNIENHHIYNSTEGLVEFSKFISICDIFISGSTGPLHIAGALNVPTAAFYPARQSATSLRWQTTNEKSKRLAFMPDKYTGKNDMLTIDMQQCANAIHNMLNSEQ